MNLTSVQKTKTDPFLKWAGGKRWLARSNQQIVPQQFNRYIEPFIGSGAIFFSINTTSHIIADANQELVDCYRAIQHDWQAVERQLKVHQKHHNDEYYYKVRASNPRLMHTKAARFIYLNRTCWNGLYRVNLSGQFNVPRGTKNSVLLDSDNFSKIALKLSSGDIICQDFAATLAMAKSGDFVFIDPPYTVKHNMNGFIKYNEKIFNWEDQERLKESIKAASTRGVMITMTNANHESIHELYSDLCEIEQVSRSSVIAGSSKHRGATTEAIMRFGWETDKN